MSIPSITQEQWLSTSDLARILGVQRNTIENSRSRGENLPPHYKVGRYVRYRQSDIEVWLEKYRRVPAATQLAETS